ncbi:MAG: HEAT repeat domain-containing protein [Candidatus Omnitrophota bacterium]
MKIKKITIRRFFLLIGLCAAWPWAMTQAEPFDAKSIDKDAIKAYDYGQSRKALSIVEEGLRNADPTQTKNIEKIMAEIIDSASATFYAKQFACRIIRRIGADESLPALEKLLRDEKLSNMARFALQGSPSPKAGAILRAAMKDVKGDLLIGVIGSVAQRQDRKAVSAIAPLIQSEDKNLARTAIAALGEIGGAKAADLLAKANVPQELQSQRDDSLLLCADALAAEGTKSRAKNIYGKFTEKSNPIKLRVAAYCGIVKMDKEDAAPTLLSLLRENDIELLQTAVGPCLRMIPGSSIVKSISEQLPSFPPNVQAMLLTALAARGDASAAPAVVMAAKSDNAEIKIAAIKALGTLGEASHVSLLAETAAQSGDAGAAAEKSLAQLRNADDEILAIVKSADAKIQPALIRSLAARRTDGAIPVLLPLALDANAEVRKESIKALSQLAKEENLPQLLPLIAESKNEDDIQAVEKAVLSIAKQVVDEAKRSEYFINALPDAPPALRISLLRMLTELGGEKACGAVRDSMAKDGDESVRHAAYLALTAWPDASPIETLLALAQKEEDSAKRKLVLKGYLRMIDLVRSDSIEQTLEKFQSALKAAKDKEEKQMVIAAASSRANLAVLDFLEGCLSDAEAGPPALEGYKKVVKQLEKSNADRNQWKVSASNNSGAAANAIDGRRRTRWDSAASQTPGQWFQIDLGTESVIEEITLDATGSNGDYPRKYAVNFSIDGNNWESPIVEGAGDQAVTKIEIPSKSARFIKIVQNGSVEGTFWSIHELSIIASASQEKLQHAYEVLKKFEKK